MTVSDIRNKLERLKGKKDQLELDLTQIIDKISIKTSELELYEKARIIIQEVGLKTQQRLQYNISEITSLALEAIMPDPYEVVINFVERRGTTECDITFLRKEMEIDPSSSGGGAQDIASFALRVASWSMRTPRNNNVLLLDEPFKHLKGESANEAMLSVVKQISERIGIQVVMISDERVKREITTENANKLYITTKKGKISKIK